MLTIYATRDLDGGFKSLWRQRPHDRTNWTHNKVGPIAWDDPKYPRANSWLIHALFPRGMKRGEIRKFTIPRLGEKP